MMRLPPGTTLFPYTTLFRSTCLVGRKFDPCVGKSEPTAGIVLDCQRPLVTSYRYCWHSNTGIISSRSEEHTSELQSQSNLVCRLLLEKKKTSEDNHRKRRWK